MTVRDTDAEEHCTFYVDVLERLEGARIPHAVGGSYAFAAHTGIHRGTKDLDLMVRREDLPTIFGLMRGVPYHCEHTFTHWLAKIYDRTGDFVDLIHNSGNGLTPVDDALFAHAIPMRVLGRTSMACAVEEMIWTKAFVMERERYDGADVAHLLHVAGATLDWERLLQRFSGHYRVLLSHVIMVGYIYPHARDTVPTEVLHTLLARVASEQPVRCAGEPVCAGTLVSREQYLADVQHWGYVDGRLAIGTMDESQIEAWTRAIRR